MELQPTTKSHVTEQQYMNTILQYQPLTRRKGKDSNPSLAYKNASFHTRLGNKDHGAGLYEEVDAQLYVELFLPPSAPLDVMQKNAAESLGISFLL